MQESITYTAQSTSKKVFNIGQVLTVAGAHFVHDTFGAFLAPLLPLIIDKLNLSLALAGSLTIYQRLPSVINPLPWASSSKL